MRRVGRTARSATHDRRACRHQCMRFFVPHAMTVMAPNPNGVLSHSPGLPPQADYPGYAPDRGISTPTGLRQPGIATDATPLGLTMVVTTMSQGSSPARATLGFAIESRLGFESTPRYTFPSRKTTPGETSRGVASTSKTDPAARRGAARLKRGADRPRKNRRPADRAERSAG